MLPFFISFVVACVIPAHDCSAPPSVWRFSLLCSVG